MKLELSKPTAADLLKPCDHLDVSLVMVTPAMAKELLKANTRNRTISKAGAEAYGGDMMLHRWGINGEAIKIGSDGVLLDGGHRLTAIATLPEGTEVSVIIFRGIDPAMQETMDGGRRRTFADQYNITAPADAKLGSKVSAALRSLAIMSVGGGGKKLTTAQLADLGRLHPKMVDSVKAVQGMIGKADDLVGLKVRPSVITALHYATHNHATPEVAALADAYILTLTNGRPATTGPQFDSPDANPAYAWFMIWNQLSTPTKARPKATISENEAINGTLFTWWQYAEGEAVKGVYKPYQYDDRAPLLDAVTAMGPEWVAAHPEKAKEEPAKPAPAAVAVKAKAADKKGGKKADKKGGKLKGPTVEETKPVTSATGTPAAGIPVLDTVATEAGDKGGVASTTSAMLADALKASKDQTPAAE